MGYEIAAGLGIKMAAPDRDVYVLVGDGSYLMMAQEIVTAVQEGVKLTILILDNHGFASIGGLSQAVGCGGFATEYRHRNDRSGGLDGNLLPVDLAQTPPRSVRLSSGRARATRSGRRSNRHARAIARVRS